MALRLVLVSAVAGLGLSLPSGDDLSVWVLRARNWINARLAEWDPPIVNEEGAFVFAAEATEPTPTEPTPTQATAPPSSAARAEAIDLVFDAVQDEMAASFASDLIPVEPAPKALLAEAETKVAPIEAPEFDPMEVGDDLYPGLAFALNREAEGVVIAPPAPAASRSEHPAPAASRSEQWAQAIRLTREAAYAWANLLHGSAVVTIEP
jgi:hypothetical protein